LRISFEYQLSVPDGTSQRSSDTIGLTLSAAARHVPVTMGFEIDCRATTQFELSILISLGLGAAFPVSGSDFKLVGKIGSSAFPDAADGTMVLAWRFAALQMVVP